MTQPRRRDSATTTATHHEVNLTPLAEILAQGTSHGNCALRRYSDFAFINCEIIQYMYPAELERSIHSIFRPDFEAVILQEPASMKENISNKRLKYHDITLSGVAVLVLVLTDINPVYQLFLFVTRVHHFIYVWQSSTLELRPFLPIESHPSVLVTPQKTIT